ncbi:MAG: hydrogenase formation protein HypD [Francisellaceae bacterium]
MKYIEEFRVPAVAKSFLSEIAKKVQKGRLYRLMEFCGGHTHAIHRYGIVSLLPENVEMIHGPGCPVCVLPIKRVDKAIWLAQQQGLIFCSYADMLRVPGSNGESLLKAKARGADVRMVYSVFDALRIARENPQQNVVFFAIGFETTTPPTAIAIDVALAEKLPNFSIYCNHVLTPVAMEAILACDEVAIDGFIGPSHVSVIIGSNAYHAVAEHYHKPVVIAGFEPLDVLQSISMLVDMINQGEIGVKNQYTRAVIAEGNRLAQQKMAHYFSVRDRFEWRGLGDIELSALKLKPSYAHLDAEALFCIPESDGKEHKQCECAGILRGVKKPKDCRLFGMVCTPENPMGACMVSSEGACSAAYQYQGCETT